MIPQIENNPFRIVGVYSDSPLIDVMANAGKLKAFAKIGKSIEMPIDSELELCLNPQRSVESIDTAVALIQSDQDKPSHALFWINRSGVDFGTKLLCSGDYKQAMSVFMQTLNNTPLSAIQDVLGDRARQLQATDILKLYVGTLLEEGVPKDIVSYCLKETQSKEQIDYLNSIENGTILSALKTFSETINSLKGQKNARFFSNLNALIVEINQAIESVEFKDDLVLQSAYDDVCLSIKSIVVGIANKTLDDIAKIEKDVFIETFQKCSSILESVELTKASENVSHKYKEDIKFYKENTKNADDMMLLAIASSEEICWFCGEKATHTESKNFERKEERSVGYNTKQVTTYTKTVQFHVCDECKKENDSRSNWTILGVLFFVLCECIAAIYISCNKSNYGFRWNWDWIWIVIIGNVFLWWLTALIGVGISGGLRWLFYKATGKKTRHFIREEQDHPIVKRFYQ